MRFKPVSALEGDTFVVSDRRGDIDSSPDEAHGLFHGDTRYLSRWIFTVDGQKPNSLSTDDVNYFSSQFFLVPGTGTVYVDSPLSIVRQRAVGGGFHEDIKIQNHKPKPIDLEVRVEADADFADLFQVKDAQFNRSGKYYRRVEEIVSFSVIRGSASSAKPRSPPVHPLRLTKRDFGSKFTLNLIANGSPG
jgi:glycogen debranching enzyme